MMSFVQSKIMKARRIYESGLKGPEKYSGRGIAIEELSVIHSLIIP